MKYTNDYFSINISFDWILFQSYWDCKLGFHSMDWENEDGEIHCYCLKNLTNIKRF